MASADFNWEMVDSNSNGAPTDAFAFDPSDTLPSSELSAQFEMFAAEFVFMDYANAVTPLAFPFDDGGMVDVAASAYDSDSTASTATVRSIVPSSAAAAAAGSFSREERRKTKQRCYEKNYRGRLRVRSVGRL